VGERRHEAGGKQIVSNTRAAGEHGVNDEREQLLDLQGSAQDERQSARAKQRQQRRARSTLTILSTMRSCQSFWYASDGFVFTSINLTDAQAHTTVIAS
jgi:hypothetical protein